MTVAELMTLLADQDPAARVLVFDHFNAERTTTIQANCILSMESGGRVAIICYQPDADNPDALAQPQPLTVPETPRHADALQDRIGERIADEVEKACHGRQTNCEQAAADILAMLKGGAS